ncbi:AMP-binding protein [Streptomyces sp. NPDC006617]|uniref:AMP-binding protein n=1 Tax=Streptomyces sp. NPDC006617 TaxID=3155354 RepID=UPI0033AA6719
MSPVRSSTASGAASGAPAVACGAAATASLSPAQVEGSTVSRRARGEAPRSGGTYPETTPRSEVRVARPPRRAPRRIPAGRPAPARRGPVDPSARHDRRSLLSPQETATQLYELAGPRVDLPALTFVDLFRQQARKRPDAPAAAHGDRTWTYRELDARSDRVARLLTAAGAGAEDLVAVVMDRTLAWIAGAIGVLKAGAVYLPMPGGLPVERVAVQLRESVCGPALTDRHCESVVRKAAAELEGDGPAVVTIEGTATGPDGPLPEPPAPEQAAYIYFTSGSTGAPKGTLCEHAGLLNCEDVGGLGVVVGHSDTSLGILLDTTAPGSAGRLAAAAQRRRELEGNVTVFHTLSFH